jgi:hypothetical protein
VKKEDIPAATQLFTPRWIVEYMVQNTVGKLWLQNKPHSRLRDHMPYFIDSPSVSPLGEMSDKGGQRGDNYLEVDSVEELTLLDQACGSGHILVYGFELFTKIYEEEGYNPSEIPQLIIEKNLFGYEIDERAAQLAGLALMMKARSYQRRLFRKEVKPHIMCYKDMAFNVYPIDGYKETFKVKKNDPALNDILRYGYYIAEDILLTWKESFIDEDTGEPVVIERIVKQVKKGETLCLDKLLTIKEFASDEISIYKDELKDVFREAAIPLSNDLYEDLLLKLQATNLGSLITPRTNEHDMEVTLAMINNKLNTNDLFISHGLNQVKTALIQLQQLKQKHHCIVDNPPYMGGGAMNTALAVFVKRNYPDSKSDLMACFMEAGLKNLHPKGYLGMINQHSWMFLSSYENLRKKLLQETFFDTLLHLGPRTFPEIGGEVVQNASFTFWNTTLQENGSYVRLVDEGSSELKRAKTLEAIQNPACGWFYTANQKDFEKIPGSPIGYWVSHNVIDLFTTSTKLSEIIFADGQNKTGNNDKYLRFHWEVNKSNDVYIHYAKGGPFRKWHGNIDYFVKWDIKSRNHYSKDKIARIIKDKYWYRKGFTFSRMSEKANVRVLDQRGTFDATTVSFFISNVYEDEYYNITAYPFRSS